MLKIENLSKSFRNKQILNNLNLHLKKGKILGLLGPNGSGKTTLMKILTNTSPFKNGNIIINGEKISHKTNRLISFLPDVPFMDEHLTVKQAISKYSYFFPDFEIDKAYKLIKELDIDENIKISKLSKGNNEKIHLILILSRKAKLYILDEPIAGVDIVTRKEILKLIIDNIDEDSSVIISTHLISDIEQIFDEVCFIKAGHIDKIYDVEDIRFKSKKSVEQLYLEYFGGDENA